MKEQTYFHIPTPCHEDWNNMTQQDKGRFCASCSKQVVDFSLMTDNQVLNYFKNTSGKVCGRFADDQLQRPMIAATEQKKKVWWVVAMTPLLLLFGKVNAQKKKVRTTGTPAMIVKDTMPPLIGEVVYQPQVQSIIAAEKKTIKGTVKNEKGNPIPFATISIENSLANAITDSAGNFELTFMSSTHNSQIIASSIGYESNKLPIAQEHSGLFVIILKEKKYELQPVEVKALTGRLGGMVTVKCVTIRKNKSHSITKILGATAFKIFPNPIISGSALKLEIKKPASYSIQLFDNNSKLILIKDITTTSNNAVTEITIPSSLAAGIYYISLINETTKKRYTDKLIVQ